MLNRTALSRESEALLRQRYGDAVTTTVIPMDARAAEAAGIGRPLTQTAPRSRAAVAIHALAAELLHRVDVSPSFAAPTPIGVSP
jgi:cellulose biosynthesis protein BcsQ